MGILIKGITMPKDGEFCHVRIYGNGDVTVELADKSEEKIGTAVLTDEDNEDNMELKACPFCGGKARLEHNSTGTQSYIRCSRCYLESPRVTVSAEYSSDEQVIYAWNRRVNDG